MNAPAKFLGLLDAVRPALLIDSDKHLSGEVIEDDGSIVDSLLLNVKVCAVPRTDMLDAVVPPPLPGFGAALLPAALIAKRRPNHGHPMPPLDQSGDGVQDPPSRPPSPPLPSPSPPSPPSPDRTPEPVRDPHLPEHPDPVREPPSDRPPMAVTSARIEVRQRPRSFAFSRVCPRSRHATKVLERKARTPVCAHQG